MSSVSNTQGKDTTTRMAMRTTTRRIRQLVIVAVTTLTAAAALALAGPAPTASALYGIQPPAGPTCDSSRLQLVVAPPRASASSGSEQVVWSSQIQRWNPTGGYWYVYSTYTNWATFNTTAFSLTSWSTLSTSRGGIYSNNYMRYPVSHAGYYRIQSAIAGSKGGATWSGLVSGGQYCQIT